MFRVRSIERPAGDVAISARILIRVKIAQPDINTKGRQPSAQRAVAPARIKGNSWQTEAQPQFLVTSSRPAVERQVTIHTVIVIRVADSATVQREANHGKPGASTDMNINGRWLLSRLDRQRRRSIDDGRRDFLEKLKRNRLCSLLLDELFSPTLASSRVSTVSSGIIVSSFKSAMHLWRRIACSCCRSKRDVIVRANLLDRLLRPTGWDETANARPSRSLELNHRLVENDLSALPIHLSRRHRRLRSF